MPPFTKSMISILIMTLLFTTTVWGSQFDLLVSKIDPPKIQVPHITQPQAFNILQSSGEDKRNTGYITATLVSLLAFGAGMTFVLCLRHHKKFCFKPPVSQKAPPSAKVAIDPSAPDSAPDEAMIRKQHSIPPEDGGFTSIPGQHRTSFQGQYQTTNSEHQQKSVELQPMSAGA